MPRLERSQTKPPTAPTESQSPCPADDDFRAHASAVGQELAQSLHAALASLPGFSVRPKWLATALGQTVATMSRLMKATRHSDPLAVALHIPGPDPLRRLLAAAREKGAARAAVAHALAAVEDFEALIQRAGGDRSTLNTILTTWVPASRREFVLRRRQAIFKNLSELKGVATAVELDAKILHPSEDGAHMDIAVIHGAFGVERIRPDVPVKFETLRLLRNPKERRATNLAGDPVADDLDCVRLDQFCNAPPAPLVGKVIGDRVQYTLAGDSFGIGASFDLVLAELNLAEIPLGTESGQERTVFFFNVIDHPIRKLVFDLFVHRDLFPGREPELTVHDTSSSGPVRPEDPERDIDRMELIERVELLGAGTAGVRLVEIPHYVRLLEHAYATLGWDPADFRGFRVQVDFPLVSSQVSLTLAL